MIQVLGLISGLTANRETIKFPIPVEEEDNPIVG